MITPTITSGQALTPIMWDIEAFLIRAALAGLGVALLAGPLGCFVVWRRMAYFGDASAHAALLGVALALLLSLPVMAGVLVVCCTLAAVTAGLTRRQMASDTLLGVAAHAGLAGGLTAIALVGEYQVDLMAFLFGDILAVSWQEIGIIWLLGAAYLLLLRRLWRPLLNATVNEELAWAEGDNPDRLRLALTLMLAGLVTVAIKIVGILLVSAMLVIPSAAARPLVREPLQMAGLAVLIAALSVLSGLQLSLSADTPAGPSIVVMAAIVFAVTNAYGLLSGRTSG